MPNHAGFSHGSYKGRAALGLPLALLVSGLVACGDTSGPPAAGSILVTTQTSGFLKPASYDLMVAGAAQPINATGQLTIEGLDPGDYDVSLANVPANCTAQGVGTVTVASNETAQAALSISCVSEPATSYTVQFSRQRPDLETGAITVCSFGICSTQEAWDMWVYSSTSTTPRSIVRQNQTSGVQIAHVEGVTLAGLNETHFTSAGFTTDLVEVPFDAQRVILLRTDAGNVYALGNPVENTTLNTLTFDAALIARP